MAKTRLCVDVNNGQISGVLVKVSKKGIRAIKSFTIDNHGYNFYNGCIYEVENIADEIKFELNRKRIYAKEVVVCVNHQDILFEEAVVPVTTNGIYKEHTNRLETRAKRESKTSIKVSYLKNQVLIDTSNMANILTVIIPQHVLDRCQSLASYLNMKLVGIADSGCAACIAYGQQHYNKSFVVDLREDGTYIYFMDNGHIRAKEYIPFKSANIVGLVKKHRTGESFISAVNILHKDMIILTAQRQSNDAYQKLGSESYEQVTNLSKMIDLTIQKILGMLHSDFQAVELTGLGASFSGINKALEQKLGVPVTTISKNKLSVDCSEIKGEKYYISQIHDVIAASALPAANLLWIDGHTIGTGNSLLDKIYRFFFGEQ